MTVAVKGRARLVVLISGRGRNLAALIAAVNDGRIAADLVAVISNRVDAAGLALAREAGVPVLVLPHVDYPDRAAFDAALASALRALEPDIVALAGFMRILTEDFVREFEGRMLNIHPSLLPRHKGLNTHAAVLRDGDAEHGATVHFVTPQLDGGPLVIQGRFTVSAQDGAQQLAERVLEQIECRIYPQAVAWMAGGELRCEQGVPRFRDRPLSAVLSLDDLEPGF
ncbi:phosphoribosylglycinamide formyltransferase [Nevskia sp.]|uniref:phosphoribosylglycinamide formyltransferase n=1 Tax=Nevskia sp. TaxID=1929292 RepID=UPI0025D77132|nr:phosphoribosylglycinamide formyltransferase [Nevskia sp.]